MTSTSKTEVSYFRPRIDGPELRIEDAVVSKLTEIFERNDWPLWIGGSVPIGAGFPDIVSVWYDPQVITLADFPVTDGHILAYLRTVRRATLETIASRLQFSSKDVEDTLLRLTESSVVARETERAFAISSAWRQILPEVITVEAKVSDWQAALQQANRNRIFAHRSFAAFPEPVAERVMKKSGFELHGVGILSVSEQGEVTVVRPARRNSPSVWDYYFHLAALAAKDMNNRNH
ncbi:MAG: hypothetical protein R3C18_14035 [Planctomycetaceae bacterium]